MFNIDPSELMLLAVVALVVIGPKDLPRAMRFVGQWVGRARGMARHFRMGIDEIIRQSELEEMEKKWASENARIMAEHPTPPAEEADDAAYAYSSNLHGMTPLPAPTPAEEAAIMAPDTPTPAAHDEGAAPVDQMSLFATPAPPKPSDEPKP